MNKGVVNTEQNEKKSKKGLLVLLCLVLAVAVVGIIFYFMRNKESSAPEAFGTIEIRLTGAAGSVVMNEAEQGGKYTLSVNPDGLISYQEPEEDAMDVGVDEKGTSLYVNGSTWSSLHLAVTPEEGYVIEKYAVDGKATDISDGVFETDEVFPDGVKVIEISFEKA